MGSASTSKAASINFLFLICSCVLESFITKKHKKYRKIILTYHNSVSVGTRGLDIWNELTSNPAGNMTTVTHHTHSRCADVDPACTQRFWQPVALELTRLFRTNYFSFSCTSLSVGCGICGATSVTPSELEPKSISCPPF